MRITFNDKDLRELESDLQTFKARAYPFATKSALDGYAFKAQSIAKIDISQSMTLRNRFTLQSIRVDKARGLNVDAQESAVGSTNPYMRVQEFGGVKVSSGKRGVPLATSYSAGQGENAQPRTKLPRRPNQLKSIQLKRSRRRGSNRKQRNLIAVKQAATSGNKFVYLDLARNEGIFKVVGTKKKPRVKMVFNLSRRSVNIPRNPWLMPAVRKTKPFMATIFKRALQFQADRHNLFGNR